MLAILYKLVSGTISFGEAPHTVTVTANDGTSSSTQIFAWTISVINLVSPGDQTNNDGDTVSLPLTTGYHGSGTLSYSATGLPPGLSINSSTGQISGTISGTADTNSPYSVTVTATDGTNTASQTFNWTVNAVVSIDSVDDQSNADGDAVSLQVSASDSLSNTLTYSATNLPSGLSIASTTGLISGTISAGADASSPYAVTVTATDSAGNSATQTLNWTVTPVGLVNPGPQSSVDGQAVSLQLQGSSGATYTATGLPSGVSINSSTGLISGTLASNADTSSPYVITATATLASHSINQTFVWTVTPTGLAIPSDQTNTEGDTVSLQLQGLSGGGTLTYSASGLPVGLSLNGSTGLITGTVAAGTAANGPFTVDAAVTNGTVSASRSFTWNLNPIVNLTAPADQNNNEGDSVSLQMSATDALSKSLTYSATALPSGLSINSSTGLISGTITVGDFSGGPYSATVTASDGTYSTSQTFTWNITQTNPTTPTLTNPGTQTNGASDSVLLPIQASDADGDTLTYSATTLPDGLDIDPNSGIISGILAEDASDPVPYDVTVTATDGNGLSASQTFTWIVNAPALNVQVVPLNAVEGVDPGSFTLATFITADLNSLPDDFAAAIDYGDGTMDGGVISGGNGSFTVTADHIYAEMGNYSVSITIYDSLTGASASEATTATVTDAPLTLTGGLEVSAIQQQSSTLTLATFTDGNSSATLSDFTATINWGDGSGNQAATVSDEGDGVFAVNGSHLYAGTGTDTATITVTDVDGSTATATSTVAIGQVYAGIPSSFVLSSFTDGNNSVPVTSFTVTIDWGDGTPQVNGAVTGGNGSPYLVSGGHTYTQDSIDQSGGVYTVTVTVNDTNGNLQTTSSTVEVVRPPLSLTVANVDIASSLTVSNEQVAMFTEPDTTDSGGEFAAQIDWGDGNSSAGTVQEVSPGLFAVLGSHIYASDNWYTIRVTISQAWQQMEDDVRGAGKAKDTDIIQFIMWQKRDFGPTKTLRIPRWEAAFDTEVKPMKLRRNFVNYLSGNFQVQVYDPAKYATEKSIEVTVKTSSDNGHTITLTKSKTAGYFESAYLVLTTFAADNQTAGNQAFNAKLGDTVAAIYGGKEASAKVPVQKIVKLHINVLKKGNNPVATDKEVEGEVADANRIYAPTGILFKIDGPIRVVNPPAKVDLTDGLDSYLNPNWDGKGKIPMTDEEKELLGVSDYRAKNEINVYYVNYLISETIQGASGESFWAGGVPDAKYADSVIIAAEFSDYVTLAHEIGHDLLNDGNHPNKNREQGLWSVNLMVSPGVHGNGSFSSRWIFAEQTKDMLSERPNLLSNP